MQPPFALFKRATLKELSLKVILVAITSALHLSEMQALLLGPLSLLGGNDSLASSFFPT